MFLIKNARLYDYTHYIDNGYLLFEERIQQVGPMSHYDKLWRQLSAREQDELQIINAAGQWALPGLINGHSHLYATLVRGKSYHFDPSSFKELLEQLWWKVDGALDDEQVYQSALAGAQEALEKGVTTMIDHHASGLTKGHALNHVYQALSEVGLRSCLAFETSDRFDIPSCLSENEMNIKSSLIGKRSGLIGLHASFTLSEESLFAIRGLQVDLQEAGYSAQIHCHIAESSEDQAHCTRNYGERVIQRLHRHGLLTKDALLAHCIDINEDELDILKNTQAVVVFNVTSNMNNGVGLPDAKMFLEKGISCILGNDGITASMMSEWLNFYYCQHHQTKSPKAFSLDDLKTMIQDTYAYASRRLLVPMGHLKEGYVADILLVPYKPITPIHQDNAFEHLLFGLGYSFVPKEVFVNGQWLIKSDNREDE